MPVQETRVRSLGWEGPLGKAMAPHSSTPAWEIPMDRGAWWATVHGKSPWTEESGGLFAVAKSQDATDRQTHTVLLQQTRS